MSMTNEYRQLKFVLKIDKKLNVIDFRSNETNNCLIQKPTSADLKATRSFRSKLPDDCKLNELNGLVACSLIGNNRLEIWDLRQKIKLDAKALSVKCLEKIDENRFATGCANNYLLRGTIKIWSTKTYNCLQTLEDHMQSYAVVSLKSLPLNRIAGGAFKMINIWDLNSGACLHTLIDNSYFVYNLICLSNGNLVSCSWEESTEYPIKVWDLDSGECLNTLTGHSSGIRCLALLNNDLVASGSDDKTIKIWNMHNRKLIKTLHGHLDCVMSLQMLVNGELISCSMERTIKVWDLYKGRCIKTVVEHNDMKHISIVMLRINKQNTTLVGSANDGTIKAWDLNRLKCFDTIQVARNSLGANDFIFI